MHFDECAVSMSSVTLRTMTRHMTGIHRSLLVGVALVAGVTLLACSGASKRAGPDSGAQLQGPLSHNGRWFTDTAGRVVMLHGFNDVAKLTPFYPAAFGFGADDAQFLAANGFNVLRLGVNLEGLMPEPGVVDTAYIEHLVETVDELARTGTFVVLDFHQDGYAPIFNGNGFPNWMAITDGERNPPDAKFPLYYVQNPAMQRAFEHFWANSPGPDGVGLQDAFMKGLEQVVRRFAGNPWVLGYEAMNEPWPGADWVRCTTAAGCPDLEATLLAPFYQQAIAVVRRLDERQFLLVEPFVLFNFGRSATSLPGFADSQVALAFHSYALDQTGEQGVVRQALDAAERQGVPVFATEFGATLDPATLDRLASQLDGGLVPWIEWAYNGMIADATQPAGLENLRNRDAFTALVRPFPVLVNGTPTTLVFDPATTVFDFGYSTLRPDGQRSPTQLLTTVSVPPLRYPQGYSASVQGARVISSLCAPMLLLRNEPGAESVSVHIEPSQKCE